MTPLSTIVDEERRRLQKLKPSALLELYRKVVRHDLPRAPAKHRLVMEHALLYSALVTHLNTTESLTPAVAKNAQLAYAANSVDDLIAAGLLLARRADMGEIISECPGFKKSYSEAAPECVACAKEFADEFTACKQTCCGGAAKATLPDGALAAFKPFRPGSQAAILLDFIKAQGSVSVSKVAEHIAGLLNVPKEKVVVNVKGYVGEWARGKVNMKPTDLPFVVVIQNDMITYTGKGEA
jgi:hypothetical protein